MTGMLRQAGRDANDDGRVSSATTCNPAPLVKQRLNARISILFRRNCHCHRSRQAADLHYGQPMHPPEIIADHMADREDELPSFPESEGNARQS
jgi:hypothetical protein